MEAPWVGFCGKLENKSGARKGESSAESFGYLSVNPFLIHLGDHAYVGVLWMYTV